VIDEVLAQRVEHMIDEEPYIGYPMVWAPPRVRASKSIAKPSNV
jgi:hypothetical protein